MPEQERTLQDYHHYITTLFAPEDDALRSTREEMQRQGLRAMNVSASEGKLLHLLALLSGTKRILEIGTLGATAPFGWRGRCRRTES